MPLDPSGGRGGAPIEVEREGMELSGFFRNRANSGAQESEAVSEGPAGVITAADSAARLTVLDDFEQAGIGWIWATDSENRLIYISESAGAKLGHEVIDLLGHPLIQLFETDPDNPDERSDRPLKFQLSARNKLTDLVMRFAVTPDGEQSRSCWWSFSGHPKFDARGKFLGYRGSAKDVTVEYERKLEDSRLAEYDSLTGLANRHRMTRRLESILAAYKSAKRCCALMMLDLDRFKHVNDTMGHPAGDELLRQVAERLRAIIGDRGEIGRLGGDEFQVILPDLDDRGKLGELANKVIQIISQPYPIDGKRAIIGTSVGIAIAPYDGIEKDEMVRAADLALYAAKKGGRGQFRFYSADLKDEEEERRLLLDDLREALATDELELHYQPVVRTGDNMVVGFEALMRWEHPERGFVSPGMFIPAAEEGNLINQLGEWALGVACKAAVNWPKSVRVAVNVSAVQFANPAFPEIVTQALAELGPRARPARAGADRERVHGRQRDRRPDLPHAQTARRAARARRFRDRLFLAQLSALGAVRQDQGRQELRRFVHPEGPEQRQDHHRHHRPVRSARDGDHGRGRRGVRPARTGDLQGRQIRPGMDLFEGPAASTEIEARMGTGEFKIEPDGPEVHRPERRSVFRRIGVIHDDHRYEAVMRDLSTTGAKIEGLLGVPVGTGLVLDLGGGQLAVCVVNRSQDANIAVEFETPLVSDGAGGLCTRHRVSPYALAAAGMPLTSLPQGNYPLAQVAGPPASKPQFLQVIVGAAA